MRRLPDSRPLEAEANTQETSKLLIDSKPKHSRTSAQKVRTGCITCKKRHVKCDETKPHCNNCLRNRGHCEGYVESKKKRHGPVQLCWNLKDVSRIPSPRLQQLLDLDSVDFQHAVDVL
jgi:hypothetical protein